MAITADEARRTLIPLIQQVSDDRTSMEVTSKNGNAFLNSAAEYAPWQETAYLFRSPENARRLLQATAEADSGQRAEFLLDRQ